MSYVENAPAYLDLMRSFSLGEMDAPTFVTQFMDRWRHDRDRAYRARTDTQRRREIELQEELTAGTIKPDEFTASWRELWGIRSDADQRLCDLVDQVFTACDAFVEDPALRIDDPNELDERSLRGFVTRAMAEHVRAGSGGSLAV